MGWVRPISGPKAGQLVWRDSPMYPAVRAPSSADTAGLPPVPSALLEGELDDGRAAMMRGRDGAARQLQLETERRGYAYTWDQARDRVGTARDNVSRRSGG